MKTTRLLATGIAVLLALTACSNGGDQAGSNGSDDLTGRTFVSTHVTFPGGSDPSRLVNGTALSLTFTDNGISAAAGCNTMAGPASVQDDVLVIDGGLSMTEMGCDPERMAQDQWYADLLTSKPEVSVDGQQLTLSEAGTAIAMTDEKVTNPDRELVGTTWKLNSIVDADSVSSVPRGVTSDIVFVTDGQLRVNFGCNSGAGEYTVVGDEVRFGQISQTLMLCTGPAGDVESSVSKVLVGAVSFSIDGPTLTLKKGSAGLVYNASSQ